MQDEHRKAIQSNFISLVEQTDLDTMVSSLYEKEVFSEQMIAPYRDTNKTERERKRQLYRDITRRGPHAFNHLLDALTEAGYWDIVRDLDPNSLLHLRTRGLSVKSKVQSDENSFVSISTQKKKTQSKNESSVQQKHNISASSAKLDSHNKQSENSEIPQVLVVKSSKFFDDDTSDIKLYRTRGRNRGMLVVLSYIDFQNNVDTYRSGVDVDCDKLKSLFLEIGFEVVSYKNLTRKETLEMLKNLKEVVEEVGKKVGKEDVKGVECLFLVVSSHGYERSGSSDTDIRCYDGRLISFHEIIEHFNNLNFPQLRHIPKVFIFQVCRGDKNLTSVQSEIDGQPSNTPTSDRVQREMWLRPPETPQTDRLYSEILIAHSTLPGYVSHRDRVEGSWYIQVLCKVFAERAHDCHVEKLFTLVDKQLHEKFCIQTSSVDKWGFNCKLYLHPGLFED